MTLGAVPIPRGVGDLDAEWLSEAFGATVETVQAERIAADSGFSSLLYRLHLTGTGVPDTVIAKLPAESDARGAMDLLGGYRRELAYYRDIAGRAPMPTPQVYLARMADNGVDFVLLLEDLAGWDNADHLAGLSLDRVRLVIAQLAGLHGWSADPANAAALEPFPSLDTPIARDLLLPVFAPGWEIYRERSATSVPSAVAAFAETFAERVVTALPALTERSMLLHGDIRADNLFFDGERLKVVDFQFAARGAGAADIAYLVTQGLPSDVRSGRDEILVREYLDRAAAHGLTDYGFDEAWRHYRLAAVYLMVLPVITLNGWDALPERSRRLVLTLVDRAVAAVDEIGALEVFA
ncbi:ecdysteroid 22-kinase family protein [Mycolicibacterium sp. F2034L]|uniref:ecdysteroid 22-kinase family protein n=1 Tax=Mycolicibacterium sp. F2034L TaxID=2926422 RepID=UPI001FF2EDDF|nr:ecdysteroid 22-kinase family protein [Mycolicibacterium sp. F2034L]MCK0174893.1 ecdysteroid 22-kinase family protein [Mycolicibacterium sp. F2034L]